MRNTHRARSWREGEVDTLRRLPFLILFSSACAAPILRDAAVDLCNPISASGASGPDGPSADLYCIELTAAPGLPDGVLGNVELLPPGGPFSVAVTADGSQIHLPRITLAGLPPPDSLGAFTTYVAWVTTEVFSPFINLGAVANGTTLLTPISLDKFVIVISAEASADVAERTGKLILRGGSPSTRMQPPDVMDFTLGNMVSDATAAAQHDHGSPHMHSVPLVGGEASTVRWTTVPMSPRIAMLPSEMALRPSGAPFLPMSPAGRRARTSVPHQVVELSSGDTLRLEATLVTRAIHGRTYTMYAYNGQTPGPLLSVQRGAEISVKFINSLDQPSTVHWHGLRLDHRMDGVPNLSQSPVAPGDSFTYQLRFPDTGLYWYHSHVREDIQQDLGLTGNMMVQGDSTLPPVHREEVLLLDDILIGDDGLVPFGVSGATHALMGRFGNVFLVNGLPMQRREARTGEIVRVWLTNAANTRTFNVSFTNARMKLVASDMSAFSSDAWVESVVIAPAERYAVDVRFNNEGQAAMVNRVRAIDHLFGEFLSEVDTLALYDVTGSMAADSVVDRYSDLMHRHTLAAEIDVAVANARRLPERVLHFGLETRGLPFVSERMMLMDSAYFNPVEWSGTMPMMNWATESAQANWFVEDAATGARNDSISLKFKVGDRAKLRLVNVRGSLHAMQHPIHVHGQRFLVLAVNGVEPSTRAWKDTVLLPAGASIDILVEFDNPGQWMLHCHIAEHVESGMMTTFEVEKK